MKSIRILENGIYIPKKKIENEELALKYGTTTESIEQRTGIKQRFICETETIEQLAKKAVENLLKKTKQEIQEIDLIIVATTSTNRIMPGISYYIQKEFEIQECICMDILAGCSGYINAFDIARNYLILGKVKKALVIGVDILSRILEPNDMGTQVLMSDGAGATLLGISQQEKKYDCLLQSDGSRGDILTYFSGENLYMNGKEIYKYAVTKTTQNIKKLLIQNQESLDNITYLIPHQSNLRILKAIAERLEINFEKVYCNIQTVGNTFCASIPIALEEMLQKNLLQVGDKIILIGYGGGLNLGSILLEF